MVIDILVGEVRVWEWLSLKGLFNYIGILIFGI